MTIIDVCAILDIDGYRCDGEGVKMRELNVLEQLPADCCAPLAATGMSEQDAEATARLFKALSDPGRVKIVNLLATADDPVCVCDLTPQLSLSQPTVSFHLNKLVKAGLLEREQRGVWAYYSVNRQALARLSTIFDLEGATA